MVPEILLKQQMYMGYKTYLQVPSGASISIPNGKRLFLDAEKFEVTGEFEIPQGSVFEFTPYGL